MRKLFLAAIIAIAAVGCRSTSECAYPGHAKRQAYKLTAQHAEFVKKRYPY